MVLPLLGEAYRDQARNETRLRSAGDIDRLAARDLARMSRSRSGTVLIARTRKARLPAAFPRVSAIAGLGPIRLITVSLAQRPQETSACLSGVWRRRACP
jgi:hypothetical protein